MRSEGDRTMELIIDGEDGAVTIRPRLAGDSETTDEPTDGTDPVAGPTNAEPAPVRFREAASPVHPEGTPEIEDAASPPTRFAGFGSGRVRDR